MLVAAGTAAVLAVVLTSPPLERLRGQSLDLSLWMRHQIFGQLYPPHQSPTVVIAIDEQTYLTPPFAGQPKALWMPEIAETLSGVLKAGAQVIGLDVVFPSSVQSRLPNLETPYLRFLKEGSRDDRIVLGKVQHAKAPLLPTRAQIMLVGGQRNVRSLNVITDPDAIIRAVPLLLKRPTDEGGGMEPSFSMELAARVHGVRPEVLPDGRVALGGRPIRGSEGQRALVNFQGENDIPTYSLADIHACVTSGNTEYLRQAFSGKVVLLGAVLDVEDRKITSKRYMTGAEGGYRPPPCHLPAPERTEADFRRESLPGVYIHAAAVNSLLRDAVLTRAPQIPAALIIGLMALLAASITMRADPVVATLQIVVMSLLWAAAATTALAADTVLPLLEPMIAAALASGTMLAFRFSVTDRQKIKLRRLFSMYLAPAVVEEMLTQEKLPELGGETREITVWFSDLADFTSISESLPPAELVPLINTYFSAITELIEQHGGFVDKFIGDAVVAVFGAPKDDPDHAEKAVRAALAAVALLDSMNEQGAFGRFRFNTRIGLNSGEALIGNIGSRRRFNYTVMGDTVNLASRLEGVNKVFGTRLLISGTTASQLGQSVVVREVGRVRVKGRTAPIRIFEPLGTERPSEHEIERLDAFDEALQLFYAGKFTEAAECFAACITDDSARQIDEAARLYAERSRALAEHPPAEWEGVTSLTQK